MADRLTDDTTRHWTRREHPLVSLIRVDGKAYRLMGKTPGELPAFPQVGLQVLPTRSIYDFQDGHIHVQLTFMTPALPEDLEVLARPLTYLTWEVQSVDGALHEIAIYDSTSALLAVNSSDQSVQWANETVGGLTVLRAGTVDQTLLRPAGDDTRIDWGYVYAAAPTEQVDAAIGARATLEEAFLQRIGLPRVEDRRMPRPAKEDEPCLGFSFFLDRVGAEPVSRHVLLAYDEIFAIKFLGRKLRPYWRKDGKSPHDLLQAAERDYARLVDHCRAFDKELMADLAQAGGEKYARMAALAYRQTLAGCGLAADANKQPLLFTKENSSNGCIATVDVIYPAAPQFLLMGPTYAKALVAPAMIYDTSPRWKFPFAPHDVGVYPQAEGQVYGGGEDSKNEADMMPVEESANLILLCAAIARMDGNAGFASRFWPQLTRWENYLEKYGEDPENQLCTDDFMGHLAHNANLSIKAILAIAAYGELCRLRSDPESEDKYKALARRHARHWVQTALDQDKDHFRIAFDRPRTWSQKYNLVWDKLLDLGVFPPEVARMEVAYYKKVAHRYGVPLDSRTRLTKTDWSLWCATLAENRTDFERIVEPIYDYLNVTSARLPFVDSYLTDNAASDGMRARPVIGGVFVKMLESPVAWKKWADRDRRSLGEYAPLPAPPGVTEIVPTSERHAALWRYSLTRPPAGWTQPGFDDSAWKQGRGGFGTRGTPGFVIGTTWDTPDIWLRREVQLPERLNAARLELRLYHDEEIEVFLNGTRVAAEPGYVTSYQNVDLHPAAIAHLKPGGAIVLAVHCHQTGGGQGVDVGVIEVQGGQD
jgi:hypothetical protein